MIFHNMNIFLDIDILIKENEDERIKKKREPCYFNNEKTYLFKGVMLIIQVKKTIIF